MYKRILELKSISDESLFLWGARQTGKSTLLRTIFPQAPYYDLLLASEFRRLSHDPTLLRQELLAGHSSGSIRKGPIIIDEVQKVPDLLDEVHWMIENLRLQFILCGSSARKVRRGHGNLLGGRALRFELRPLVFPEIPDFSLPRALNSGLLPRHYLRDDPVQLLEAYVGDYLKEEIAAEALTRNIPAFSRFLEVAALSNGEMVSYANIASDCGVSAPTVRGYFEILEDTLIGRFLPTFRKRAKRRLIQAPRFYFFDVGVVRSLTRRGLIQPGSELFGRALEHFVFMELSAHSSYSRLGYPLAYWRTASQFEVDFVLGDHDIAVEVKATAEARDQHLKGLRAFKQEYKAARYLLVSLDPRPRRTEDGIDILPWDVFLDQLWSGKLIH